MLGRSSRLSTVSSPPTHSSPNPMLRRHERSYLSPSFPPTHQPRMSASTAPQDHDVYKQRLAANGSPVKTAEKHNVDATKKAAPPTANVTHGNGTVATVTCGSCYGAEEKAGDCCNTCDEVGARREVGRWG